MENNGRLKLSSRAWPVVSVGNESWVTLSSLVSLFSCKIDAGRLNTFIGTPTSAWKTTLKLTITAYQRAMFHWRRPFCQRSYSVFYLACQREDQLIKNGFFRISPHDYGAIGSRFPSRGTSVHRVGSVPVSSCRLQKPYVNITFYTLRKYYVLLKFFHPMLRMIPYLLTQTSPRNDYKYWGANRVSLVEQPWCTSH